MKNMKPIALILFGLAVILSTIGFPVKDNVLTLAFMFIVPAGLLICLVGLIWAFKQQ